MCSGIAEANKLPQVLTDDDFPTFTSDKIQLGQLLFYDKILSGNRNISCGTCHHPDHGTSDGLSLGIGEGGIGLGPKRTVGADLIKKRIPRNSTALWNLGSKEINVLFHDGRLSKKDTYENTFDSPAEEWLPIGFDSILAAQAIFPLVSQFEMAGNPGENDVAGAAHDRIDAPWPIIAKRVRNISEYGTRFVSSYEHIDDYKQINIVDIANALAAFISSEWKTNDSRYDKFISGNETILTSSEKSGMDLFFGKARCNDCHNGKLLSDQKFYSIGLPSFGPGRTRIFDPIPRDTGHMAETDDLSDAYRFRTPMLRNIKLSAPYGHNGAYPDIKGIIKHHLNPKKEKGLWNKKIVKLPKIEHLSKNDFIIQEDVREMIRQSSFIDIKPVKLSDAEINNLVLFMDTLTGETTERIGIPESVPSGLSID